jgi:hypothetical protein
MRLHPAVLVVATASLAAACVPRAAPPPAAPAPRPRPVTAPAPPPTPVPRASSDWRDWALTPGDWRYEGTRASFGGSTGPLLTLNCDRVARRMMIGVAAAGAGAITIRTTSTSRSFPVAASVPPPETALPASDPLLDAIGFSRGRFVVERPGAPPLVVPAYAEILRVVEDCRG